MNHGDIKPITQPIYQSDNIIVRCVLIQMHKQSITITEDEVNARAKSIATYLSYGYPRGWLRNQAIKYLRGIVVDSFN